MDSRRSFYRPRRARYSAKDSALWMACCLPFGSFGSMLVGAGSRVASPPPKPLPAPDIIGRIAGVGCVKGTIPESTYVCSGVGLMKATGEEAPAGAPPAQVHAHIGQSAEVRCTAPSTEHATITPMTTG